VKVVAAGSDPPALVKLVVEERLEAVHGEIERPAFADLPAVARPVAVRTPIPCRSVA